MTNKFPAFLLVLTLSVGSLYGWSIPGLSKTTDSAEKAAETVPTSEADISKALTKSISDAKASMGDNPEMKSLLNNIGKQAIGGDDVSMIESLKGLTDIPGANMLTGEQKELLTEVQGHAQALALTRHFSDDPSMAGPVTDAVKAVQTGDTTAAVSSLKAISEKGSLSATQKTLLKSMLGDYGAYMDSASKAADAVNSMKSLF